MIPGCRAPSPSWGHAARAALLAVLAGLAGAAPLSAQQKPDLAEASLEDLLKAEVDTVYGASRYGQRINEAPASVTIISREEIAAYGHRTLADVLRSMPGLHVRYDRNYSYIGVRGFSRPGDYNLRVLLLVDGHRENDNIYDAAEAGTEFPIDLDLVERIEIIRGPNASLYGTSAFLAVINIVTSRGATRPGLTASATLGSLGTGAASLSYGTRRASGLDLLLSVSTYASDGQRRLYYPEYVGDGSDGVVLNADGDRATRFFANLAFGGLRVRAVAASRRKHIPTGAFDSTFGDTRTVTDDARGYVDAQYERSFGVGTVTGRAYYDRYSYWGDYAYTDPGAAPGVSWINRDEVLGEWWGGELRLTTPAGRAHRASVGVELVQNQRQDQANFDVDPRVDYLNQHSRRTDLAAYAQDQWAVTDRLSLNGSMRFDRHGRLDWTFSPRMAAVLDVQPRTTLKVLFGRVFRFPNAFEEYYTDLGVMKENPNLQPEAVNTWEAMVDQRLGQGLRVTAGAFASRLTDLIDQRVDESDGLIMFDNMRRVTARGLEFEVEARPPRGSHPVFRASYSAQWATESASREALTDSPRHLLKMNGIVPLPRWRTTIGAEAQFTSRRRTLAGGFVGAYWLANVTLTRAGLLPGLDGSVGVYNLLGARYADPGGTEHRQDAIFQDGRTLQVRFSYRLPIGLAR